MERDRKSLVEDFVQRCESIKEDDYVYLANEATSTVDPLTGDYVALIPKEE